MSHVKLSSRLVLEFKSVGSNPFVLGGWKTIVEEEGVWGAVGCHPKKAHLFTAVKEHAQRIMLAHPKMIALGEIGLDYSGMSVV